MPTPKRYIFDTSVLIAFSNLRKLGLLCKLYETVIIPEAVEDEFDEKLPGCFDVIKVNHLLVEFLQIQTNIGHGEAAVITHCLNCEEAVTCFIDDRKARKIAESFHLKVSGTMGILMKMEAQQLIPSAYEDALLLKKKGFYVSDKIIKKMQQDKIPSL